MRRPEEQTTLRMMSTRGVTNGSSKQSIRKLLLCKAENSTARREAHQKRKLRRHRFLRLEGASSRNQNSVPSEVPQEPDVIGEKTKSPNPLELSDFENQENSRGGTRTRDPGIMSAVL
jgi:hypothetical protein